MSYPLIAEQLRAQASKELEWLELFMSAGDIARTIKGSSQQALALRKLGTALAQAQQWEQAERVISTIQDNSQQAEALRRLSTDLAEARMWAEAGRVISTIVDRTQRAEALRELGKRIVSAKEFEQLLYVIQRAWRQAGTREEALALFSMASAFISHKPQVGIAFFDAFTWVDTFLGG